MAQGSPRPLSAARKTGQMVGRTKVLKAVHKAIYGPGQALRVVLIRAEGGYGKTRLLEEVLWRAGHPRWRPQREMSSADRQAGLEWASPGTTTISDLVDLIDTTLQERDRFIGELRNSLHWPEQVDPQQFDPEMWQGIETTSYDAEYYRLQQLRVQAAPLSEVRRVADEATKAFLDDIVRETAVRRVVIALDTVEQLSYVTSEWLMDNHLLEPDDLAGRTHQWLENILSEGHRERPLQNLTLLLFGRGKQGGPFFESIQKAIQQGQNKGFHYEIIDRHVKSFDEQETQQYFKELTADWEGRSKDEALQTGFLSTNTSRITRYFDAIARAEAQTPFQDTYRVLRLLTEGIPVRLALYAQLIVEGHRVPKPLRWNYEQAQKEVKQRTKAVIQWEIEDEFIMLLFRQQTDLRAQILLTLARTPRGLNAEQLCFILYAGLDAKPATWRAEPGQLHEITELLKSMVDLYLVKRRASWSQLAKLRGNGEEEEKSISLRLGLQDEIYRIYAEHMAPFQPPETKAVKKIKRYLNTFSADLDSRCESEKGERRVLYQRLQAWAAYQLGVHRRLKRIYLKNDETQFEADLRPNDPATFSLRKLENPEVEQRDWLQAAINIFQVEEMIYALVRRPDYNFNRDYTDLGYFNSKADEEGADFAAQAAAWQVLYDEYGVYLKFADFRKRPDEDKRTAVDVLQQAMLQEDVSRWLKRFVIWGYYDRAIKFAERVEAIIRDLPAGNDIDQRNRYTWHHPLSEGERHLWTAYAQIYTASNNDIPAVNEALRTTLTRLGELYEATVEEEVFSEEYETPIMGFKGIPDKGIPDHPARNRLGRLLSYGSNILGYGYISVGRVHDAVTYYGRALAYVRGDEGDNTHTHRAIVLNNLSRALADLGEDSTAVCLDGLHLRLQEAAEIPLAYSYNTLALIHDRLREPTRAWDDAAKAVAYFRRAEFRRGLGLALLQLAGAMRHLAGEARSGETAIDQPARLCDIAEGLLREALDLFTGPDRPINEPMRIVEILTEFGNLNRDRLLVAEDQISANDRQTYYDLALKDYAQAQSLAEEKELWKYVVDIQVNTAWLQIYKGEEQLALEILEQAEATIARHFGDTYFIDTIALPPVAELGDPWILPQLSKVHSLRGRVAMAAFRVRDKEIEKRYPESEAKKRHLEVSRDEVAIGKLARAAEEYTLAIGYAEHFSPRSATVSHLLSKLYNEINDFSAIGLEDFQKHAAAAQRTYQHLNVAAILGPFLPNVFGLTPLPQSDQNELNGHDGIKHHED